MSATDNWIRLYRWWQEQLKSHFNVASPANIMEQSHARRRPALQRRSSLMSFRSANNSKLINIKKRASFGGIEQREQLGDAGFRCVRDSLRRRNSRSVRSTTTATAASSHRRSVNCKSCQVIRRRARFSGPQGIAMDSRLAGCPSGEANQVSF